MRSFVIPLILGLTGCVSNVNNSIVWNSVGENRSLICKDKNISVDMIKFGHTERSLLGQALKVRNMKKKEECFIVESGKIARTGVTFIFPLIDEFPESFRGIKSEIEEVEYKRNKYWLIKTANKLK
ncbi:MAG: hypothetical protein K2X69_06375 [Silvanigrellaceae bacterium]|nr:hypothetical protein [Silvanigrellaceae bacterium]